MADTTALMPLTLYMNIKLTREKYTYAYKNKAFNEKESSYNLFCVY